MSAIRNWRKPWNGPIAQVRSCHRHRCEQLQQRPVDTTTKWHCLSKVSRRQATSIFFRCLEYSSAGLQLLHMTTSSSSSLWFLLWPRRPKREVFWYKVDSDEWNLEMGGELQHVGVYDCIWQLQHDHAHRHDIIIIKILWLPWQWKFKFNILMYVTMCDTVSFVMSLRNKMPKLTHGNIKFSYFWQDIWNL